jgi:hypothetical protein
MHTGYSYYQIYQAERTRSATEQRRIDDDHGELAAAVSRRWRRITAPLRSLRSLRRPAYPAQGTQTEPRLARSRTTTTSHRGAPDPMPGI